MNSEAIVHENPPNMEEIKNSILPGVYQNYPSYPLNIIENSEPQELSKLSEEDIYESLSKRPKLDEPLQNHYKADQLSNNVESLKNDPILNGNGVSKPGERRILIVPHNRLEEGESAGAYWYSWAAKELTNAGFPSEVGDMPDPHLGREVFWVPSLLEDLHVDHTTVLIGHGIGAAAALRFAECNEVEGVVLVDPGHQHGKDAYLKATYYFDRDWNWTKILKNTKWIIQFSTVPENKPNKETTVEEKPKDEEGKDLDEESEPIKALENQENDTEGETRRIQRISSWADQVYISKNLGTQIIPLNCCGFQKEINAEIIEKTIQKMQHN